MIKAVLTSTESAFDTHYLVSWILLTQKANQLTFFLVILVILADKVKMADTFPDQL